MPKWIFTHDPEQYAIDNYAKAAVCVMDGMEFDNTNIPSGHVPTLWTMEEVLALEAEGKKFDLLGGWS